MRLKTKREGIQAAEFALNSYEDQFQGLKKLRKEIEDSRSKIEQELQTAYGFLAEGLLTSSTEASVKRVSRETGMLHLESARMELASANQAKLKRSQEIEQLHEYTAREEYIGVPHGIYTQAYEAAAAEVDICQRQINPYLQDEDFLHLLRRKEEGIGAGKKFLEALIGIQWWLKRKEKRVLRRLNGRVMDQLFFDHQIAKNNLKAASEVLAEKKAQYDYVEGLAVEHQKLREEIEAYSTDSLRFLRKMLAEYLESHGNLRQIHKHIRSEARIMLASIIAKQDKFNYYRQMAIELTREIDDRVHKAHAILRVQKIWKRYPTGYLSGDKRNWLVELPEKKARSARKRTSWMRSMHYNIEHFHDYTLMDHVLLVDATFLTYDLIARLGIERMPYDGFAQQVLREVREYRTAHHQTRPDYRQLDQWLEEGKLQDEQLKAAEVEAAAMMASVLEEFPAQEEVLEGTEMGFVEKENFQDIS